jgi:hypothetical protein
MNIATLTRANTTSKRKTTAGFAKLPYMKQSNVSLLEKAPGDLSTSTHEARQIKTQSPNVNDHCDSKILDMERAGVDADFACELALQELWFGRVLTVSEKSEALVAMSSGDITETVPLFPSSALS